MFLHYVSALHLFYFFVRHQIFDHFKERAILFPVSSFGLTIKELIFMDVSLKERLLSKDRWLRVLFMIVFAIVGCVVKYVIWALAVVQVVISFVKE